MTRHSKLQIGVDETGRTVVELDGVDVAGALSSLTLRLEPGQPAVAQLDLIVLDVSTMSKDLDVYIPEDAQQLLIGLGWTPPEGDGAS